MYVCVYMNTLMQACACVVVRKQLERVRSLLPLCGPELRSSGLEGSGGE